MNYGKVSGNLSEGKGAVYFNSTGRFDVLNDVMIEDNTTSSGAKANIYLETGRTITVTGDLNASRIGVTTARQPAASPGRNLHGNRTGDKNSGALVRERRGYGSKPLCG